MVAARYFDTRSSRAHPVVLIVQGGQAILHDAEGAEVRRAPLASLRVSERNKRAPRLVTFDDGAYCEVADHATFEAMLASTGHREGWVSRAQNSWRLTGLALLGMLAVVLGAYFYLLPWSAEVLASTVPASIEAQLGQATLDSLDHGLVTPSKLPAADQQRIRDNFAALRRPDDPDHAYQLLFRHGDRLGANALALPGGTIVVTDELVALIGTGAGMMGVLAHEAGHVAQRHGLQQVIQASAVGARAAYFFGDFSTVLATVPAAMLTMRYSRDHEREADAYAVEVMRRNRLPVSALADVLGKLEDAHGGKSSDKSEDDASFFSTHPLTRERIEAIRAAGN
jgi:Zn-dependent protease with chaperone function